MRGNVPIAYSEGFNPHQVFSFAAALSVGVTSEAEYMDLKLTKTVDINELITLINDVAPTGIHMVSGVALPEKEPKAMAALSASSYIITSNTSYTFNETSIKELLANETLIIQKKNKKGKIKDVDIRPGIYDMKVIDGKLHTTLATGSVFNIKPEQLLQVLLEKNDHPFDKNDFGYHRTEMYQNNEGLHNLLTTVKG